MDSIITNFINEFIQVGEGLAVMTTDVVNEYIKFNNQSTAGKLKLYAKIQSIAGVSKVRTEFIGISLKETIPAVAEPPQQTMTAYQTAKLALKQKEMMLAKELQENKTKAEKMLATELQEMDILDRKDGREHQRLLALQLKKMDLDDKQKDREFIAQENNKNRKMFIACKFNEYTDLQVYGSPSKQYITQESLTNVLGFNAYNGIGHITKNTIELIESKVESKADTIPIIENGITKNIPMVDVQAVSAIVDTIASDKEMKRCLEPVLNKVESIGEVAVRDEHRYIQNEYNQKKQIQQPEETDSTTRKVQEHETKARVHQAA